MAVLSAFYTEAATISSKELLSCTHEAEWTPFQTHYLSENLSNQQELNIRLDDSQDLLAYSLTLKVEAVWPLH
jgi:hypothetical protein